MPTKRQRRTRRRLQAPGLSASVVDFLLGDKRPEEEIERMNLDRPGSYDPFDPWDHSQASLEGLWREHKTELLAEWRRRGAKTTPWFGRHLSAGGS